MVEFLSIKPLSKANKERQGGYRDNGEVPAYINKTHLKNFPQKISSFITDIPFCYPKKSLIFVDNDGMSKDKFLTGYEQRALKGWEKSKADQIKDGKMLEATLKKVLLHEIQDEEILETGEAINLPIIDLLVIKKVGYDLDHPEKINLKDYSNVLGETKQEVAVSTEDSVMELFKGVYNGSSSKQPSRTDT